MGFRTQDEDEEMGFHLGYNARGWRGAIMGPLDDDRRRRNWIPRLADRVRRLIEMAGEGEPAPSQEELEKIIQGYVPEGAEGGRA